jgi:hypothetical protein
MPCAIAEIRAKETAMVRRVAEQVRAMIGTRITGSGGRPVTAAIFASKAVGLALTAVEEVLAPYLIRDTICREELCASLRGRAHPRVHQGYGCYQSAEVGVAVLLGDASFETLHDAAQFFGCTPPVSTMVGTAGNGLVLNTRTGETKYLWGYQGAGEQPRILRAIAA